MSSSRAARTDRVSITVKAPRSAFSGVWTLAASSMLAAVALPAQVTRVPTRIVRAGPQGTDGARNLDEFGAAVWGAWIGGRGIVAIGAPRAGSKAWPDVGAVIVLADRKPLWRVKGRRPQDTFGWNLAAIDREGAGVPDALAIAAVQTWGFFNEPGPGPGRIELRRLSDGELLCEASGQVTGDRFGSSLCAVQDLDHDGFAEIAIGATEEGREPGPPPRIGYVSVLSTKDGSVFWTAHGAETDRRFGASLALGADCDQDGLDDLFVGAPGRDDKHVGRIAVISSSSGKELASIDPNDSWIELGSSLLTARDLDSDACRDVLAVGLQPISERTVKAFVYLISGADLGLRAITSYDNLRLAESFGHIPLALGRAGDGSARIAVGLPGGSDDQMSECEGAVEICDLSGARVARFEPGGLEWKRIGDGFFFTGTSVAAIQDAPVDQESTWLVGAPGFLCLGSVAIVAGTDWNGRQLLVEDEFLERKKALGPPGKAPRFGSLGREDPRKP